MATLMAANNMSEYCPLGHSVHRSTYWEETSETVSSKCYVISNLEKLNGGWRSIN